MSRTIHPPVTMKRLDACPPRAWRNVMVTRKQRADERLLCVLARNLKDKDDLPSHGARHMPHFT